MENIIVAIADDNSVFRSISKYVVEKAGGNVVIEAHNGTELIDSIHKSNVIPHICLLDINMPVLDGFATAKYLNEQWPSINIIGQTSYLTDEIYQRMKKNGAKEVITKKNQFLEVLRVTIEQHSGQIAYSGGSCGHITNADS